MRGRSLRTGAVLVAVLMAGCGGDVPPLDPERVAGPLDLSRVVAVGDGYAAGAMDDALYRSGQEASVLALLLSRSARRGIPAQPLVADPGFSISQPGAGRLALEQRVPPRMIRLPRGGPPLDLDRPRPYDNLGVPGALVVDALVAESGATSTLGNPFYDLVLRGRGTVPEQVAELDATLILLWIGTADALLFATAGGDSRLAPGLPTPVGTFALAYERLIDALTATTDRVVLFNVPDVAALPFVTTVPTVVVDPATGEPVTISVLEPEVDPVTGDTTLVRRERTVPLRGPEGPLGPGVRVTLEALPLLEAGIGIPTVVGGTGEPLPDRVVLDAAELAQLAGAVAGYNGEIARIAAERDLPVVDVAGLVAQLLATGVVSDGVRLSATWPGGQAFSLDGARFTAKGYGVVTNRLIEVLNARYGSALPRIRTADLPGVPLLE